MKSLCIIILLFTFGVNARTPLYREPEATPSIGKRELVSEVKAQSKKIVRKVSSTETSSNHSRQWMMAEIKGSPIVSSQGAQLEAIRSLKAGEIKTAIIHQSLIALYDAKSPVTAQLELKSGENFTLIGEATLERNSKR